MIAGRLSLVLCFLLCSMVYSQFYTCSSTLKKIVSTNEGTRKCISPNMKGQSTIGVGFKLENGDASYILQDMGYNFNLVKAGKACLNDNSINKLFDMDLLKSEQGTENCVSTYHSLPTCVRNVLIDMSFHMGATSLCRIPKLIEQLTNKDYSGAVKTMSTSPWCIDANSRCKRNMALIQSLETRF